MTFTRTWLLAAVALLGVAAGAAAQTTNGTISGHVADQQGLALPGVTVNAASPNLQGIRTVVTTENGDFVFPLLPSGTYTISFELSGFERVTRTVTLAPTQILPVDAQMGPARVTESVTVIGKTVDALTRTATIAVDLDQDTISKLPTTRDINATLLMAPSVHASGSSGAISIAGAPSWESNFMVNGVTVNENLRGQANNLYIEDAIQETTISTGGVSAEFGRFTGGVVNVITKSGGNTFSGSFRDTLLNDNWRSLTLLPQGTPVPGDRTQIVGSGSTADGTPYPGDVKFNHVVPTYEYTFGGPVAKDHLWFFTAGRLQEQIANRQTLVTNIPYTFTDNQKRYEGKLTYSLNSNHRVQGAYTKIVRDQINSNQFNVMDVSSLYNASLPQDLYTVNYNGIMSPSFVLEGRYSLRHSTTIGAGSPFTDLINGTLVTDRARGTRYWTSTFCGVCDPEDRNNDDLFVKGSYFLSKKGVGSHNMVFGYDGFNDIRFANNHQSGSDWRILGTTSIIQGTAVFPEFLNNGSTILQNDQIVQGTQGTNFRTLSLFYNDNWRYGDRLTFNLGVRWDKNHGVDGAGNLTANDSGISPRLAVVWDPKGDGRWSVNANFAKYVAAIANTIGDATSIGGNPITKQWVYSGPSINPSATAASFTTTPVAIQQVFNWFNANGGTSMPLVGVSVPGLNTRFNGTLDSPNVLEYAAGFSRQLSPRASVRVDGVYRTWRDLYSQRIDTSTGTVLDPSGNKLDVSVIENSNALKRKYTGMTVTTTYHAGARTDLGGNYTLSRLWGNFDGENATSGPITSTNFQYPEYRNASWYAPEGDLSEDQRHRVRLWINYGVPRVDGLTVSALQDVSSGLPYGAIGQVNAIPYVNNPGYGQPQGGSTENYYFTARDAFRTDASIRTDLSVSYDRGIRGATHLFVQAQVINLFNQFQLCGCGDSVFNNGGPVLLTRIGQTVLTNSNTPSLAKFNPLTDVPVQGVNWNFGPNFGTALSRMAYTSPRMLRVSFGVRF
jgi:hypothetical protein